MICDSQHSSALSFAVWHRQADPFWDILQRSTAVARPRSGGARSGPAVPRGAASAEPVATFGETSCCTGWYRSSTWL